LRLWLWLLLLILLPPVPLLPLTPQRRRLLNRRRAGRALGARGQPLLGPGDEALHGVARALQLRIQLLGQPRSALGVSAPCRLGGRVGGGAESRRGVGRGGGAVVVALSIVLVEPARVLLHLALHLLQQAERGDEAFVCRGGGGAASSVVVGASAGVLALSVLR
jgi:hypothetical protein